MIGLIVLATNPVELAAQTISYAPPRSAPGDIALTAYQQPNAAENASSPLPLKPHAPADRAESDKRSDGIHSVVTVGGSLAAVLGIFLSIVWVLRRASRVGQGTLPADAFEVLGRAPLAGHQQVHLLRCGDKLLLIAVAAAGGNATTLTEITDPAEVERLAGLCRQGRGTAPPASFRQVLRQVEGRRG